MLRNCLWLIFFFCGCSYSFDEGRLIFAIDLVRHGDRTPLISSSEMQKIWPQGLGQLTPKGMRQEFDLGSALRQRYVDQYHLLPPYFDTKTMIVRSTNVTRTMMSAQSILFGLYPLGTGPSLVNGTKALPQGMQPIPINTVPPEQDSLLLPKQDKKQYQWLLDTFILNNPEWINKELELKPRYKIWSEIFKVSINNLTDLIAVGDRLYIESLYQIPPPSGIDSKEAHKIIAAGQWAFLRIINHPQYGLTFGTELAEKIKEELHLAVEKDRSVKYLLFVAHDTTIAAQLKILGQTIDDLPPYASYINYSLFDMGASHYEVRVTYNQKPLFIKQCGGTACDLGEFDKLLSH